MGEQQVSDALVASRTIAASVYLLINENTTEQEAIDAAIVLENMVRRTKDAEAFVRTRQRRKSSGTDD